MSVTAPLRVAIADDHATFARVLHTLLGADPRFDVVGWAASGREAVDLAVREHPDVVLMDLNMPGWDGIEATRRLVTSAPHVAVLILTMFDDDESVFGAMRAGARGYLLKGARQDEIARSIVAVASGEAIFGAPIARRMVDYFASRGVATAHQPFPELTGRETDVLRLLASGATDAVIGEHLVLTTKTVRNYVSSIVSKLQVQGRAELIVRARRAGLADEADPPSRT